MAARGPSQYVQTSHRDGALLGSSTLLELQGGVLRVDALLAGEHRLELELREGLPRVTELDGGGVRVEPSPVVFDSTLDLHLVAGETLALDAE